MAKGGWNKTKKPGVRYRLHPTRKNGVGFDRYYVIRYQRDGRRVEEPVGWASEGWTVEKAADELAELKRAAKLGEAGRSLREKREADERRRHEDQVREREALRQAERNRPLKEIVKLFLADAEIRLRKKTVMGYRSCLEEAKDFRLGAGLPALGDWPIRDIERRHLAGLIAKVAKRSPAKAVLMRSSLSALYSFAIHSPEEYVDTNPVRDIKRPAAPMPRERYLSDEEIKKLWKAMVDETVPGDEEMKRMIRFSLFTGCRLQEAAGLSRREVSGDWWEIPGNRFKGKRPHLVFLTKTAKALLKDGGEMPFASPRKGKAYDTSSIARYFSRAGYFGMPPFGLHDMRRTLGSGLARMGFSLEVISAVLGHKLPGVTGAHYLKHRFDREKQQALEAWERHVLALIEGKKEAEVIPLKSARKKGRTEP